MLPPPAVGAVPVVFDDWIAASLASSLDALADELTGLARSEHASHGPAISQWRGASRRWFDDRSASYVANLAIRGFVEERLATRELVREGLRQVEADAPSVSPEEVRDWLLADDDRPFPEGRKAP